MQKQKLIHDRLTGNIIRRLCEDGSWAKWIEVRGLTFQYDRDHFTDDIRWRVANTIRRRRRNYD